MLCHDTKKKKTVHTRMSFTVSRNESLRMKGKNLLKFLCWTRVPFQYVTGITETDSQVINTLMSTRWTKLSSCEKHDSLTFHKASRVTHVLFLRFDRKIPNLSGSYWRNFSANSVVSGQGVFKLHTNFAMCIFCDPHNMKGLYPSWTDSDNT